MINYISYYDVQAKVLQQVDEGACLLKITKEEFLSLKEVCQLLDHNGWIEISTDRLDIQDGIIAYAWEIPVCLED